MSHLAILQQVKHIHGHLLHSYSMKAHGGDRKTFEVKMLLTNSIHVQLQADLRKFKLINVR
jgi:hypothetical protein